MVHNRADVQRVIGYLLNGLITREDAALWASHEVFERAEDELLDEALEALALVDAQHGEGGGDYLYDLDELRALSLLLQQP